MSETVFPFSRWPKIETQLITKILNGNVKRSKREYCKEVCAIYLHLNCTSSQCLSISVPLLMSA